MLLVVTATMQFPGPGLSWAERVIEKSCRPQRRDSVHRPVPGLTGERDKGRQIYKRASKRETRGDGQQARCRESSSTLRLEGTKLVFHYHRGLALLEALSPSILFV